MHKIRKMFSALPDPRAPNALHDLLDVIVIALATVLCGGQGATDMEVFASSKEKLLRQFLRLPHGIPVTTRSAGSSTRSIRRLSSAFRSFMAAFAEANGIKLTGVVAVDGKAVRGAYERGRSATPLHMVNVFATEARMALAACKAPGRNETQGALDVLQMLSLEGCIVTADALHCNRPFAKKVLERGAHYVLVLKENQGKLFAEAERCFARSGKRSVVRVDRAPTIDTKPGAPRSFATPAWVRQTAFQVGGPRSHHLAPTTAWQTSRQARRALLLTVQVLSRPNDCCRSYVVTGASKPASLGARCRLRRRRLPDQDNGPENFAILRRAAVNLVRPHPARISMRQKVKRAGWEDDFLLSSSPHAIALPWRGRVDASEMSGGVG